MSRNFERLRAIRLEDLNYTSQIINDCMVVLCVKRGATTTNHPTRNEINKSKMMMKEVEEGKRGKKINK